MHLGEVAVEDHDLVIVAFEVGQRRLAVEDDVDRHALAAQSVRDSAGKLPVVFNDEHSHSASRPAASPDGLTLPTGQTRPYPTRGYSGVTAPVPAV